MCLARLPPKGHNNNNNNKKQKTMGMGMGMSMDNVTDLWPCRRANEQSRGTPVSATGGNRQVSQRMW